MMFGFLRAMNVGGRRISMVDLADTLRKRTEFSGWLLSGASSSERRGVVARLVRPLNCRKPLKFPTINRKCATSRTRTRGGQTL